MLLGLFLLCFLGWVGFDRFLFCVSSAKMAKVLAVDRSLFWEGVEESVRLTFFGKEQVEQSGLTLVLDMNGVLLHRESAGERVSSAPRPCDFCVGGGRNKRRVWLRPHLEVFMLFAFRRHSVGFWTSAMAHNALPILDEILKRPQQTPRFILTRADTTPDRSANASPWATIKDLNVVSPIPLPSQLLATYGMALLRTVALECVQKVTSKMHARGDGVSLGVSLLLSVSRDRFGRSTRPVVVLTH